MSNLKTSYDNLIKKLKISEEKLASYEQSKKNQKSIFDEEENYEMEEIDDDEDEEDEMATKLADYMAFQREKNNWSEIMKKRDLYNMILI